MSGEYKDDPSFQPWGPFISDTYKNEPITKGDIVIASIVWGLTLINVIVAIYLIYKQTRGSRSPLRSVYVWMIWLELIVSFTMGLESFLHLLKYIRPSKSYIARHLTGLTLTLYRLCFLLYHSLLLVYSSSASAADHHQPYPCHCT
jgi:hypothetical protein